MYNSRTSERFLLHYSNIIVIIIIIIIIIITVWNYSYAYVFQNCIVLL
jgi:uncharacterized membrane protein YdbT with pleckstrin-like domain